MNNTTEKNVTITKVILLLCISAASVNAVFITPALPLMQKLYMFPPKVIQQVIAIFLIGYMLGQLMYAPIADKYGRRIALLCGFFLSLIGLGLCILATWYINFQLLLIGRFLSALGSSAGLVCSFIFINELFAKKQAQILISYSTVSFTLGSGLAVCLGGWFTDHFGIASCFMVLFAHSGILFILAALFLPEPLSTTATTTNLRNSWRDYIKAFKNYRLLNFSILLSVPTIIVYAYAAAGSIITKHFLQLSAENYGFWNLCNALSMLLGGVLSAQLIKRFNPMSVLKTGFILLFFLFSGFMMYYATNSFSAWLFFLLTSGIFLCCQMVFVNAAAYASTALPQKSQASAIMNFINLGATFLAVSVMGILPGNVFLQFLLIITLALSLGMTFIIFQPKEKEQEQSVTC